MLGKFRQGSTATLGFLGVLVGVASPFWGSKLDGKYWILAVGIVIAIFGGLWHARRRYPDVTLVTPNTRIRLVVGDILNEDALVVGMTNTFDTAVPDAIAPDSLQAQVMDRIFGGVAALDSQIDAQLINATIVGRFQPTDGKLGKQNFYPVGTVLRVSNGDKVCYLAAYSRMSNRCEAISTVDQVWHTLTNVWGSVRAFSNGAPISVPVIGQGQSRISHALSAQDSVKLILLSFVLASRSAPVCRELRIVVTREQISRLDLYDLGLFFDSLS